MAMPSLPPSVPKLEVIFAANPDERIRGITRFRNWLIIATDQRALRWDPDSNTIEVIGFMDWRTDTDVEAVAAAVRKASIF